VNYYFDTSALCRYYHPEPGSDRVERVVQDPQSKCLLSWLSVVETQSAFALKVRNQEIAAADFAQLRKRLKADIAQRRFPVVRMLRRHFDRAEWLLVKYALQRRLRSLDALHLGVALELRDHQRVGTFVTADSVLFKIAQSEGLTVLNPLSP